MRCRLARGFNGGAKVGEHLISGRETSLIQKLLITSRLRTCFGRAHLAVRSKRKTPSAVAHFQRVEANNG
jgi:hypothetical protein